MLHIPRKYFATHFLHGRNSKIKLQQYQSMERITAYNILRHRNSSQFHESKHKTHQNKTELVQQTYLSKTKYKSNPPRQRPAEARARIER
jgi:hypothetical protein